MRIKTLTLRNQELREQGQSDRVTSGMEAILNDIIDSFQPVEDIEQFLGSIYEQDDRIKALEFESDEGFEETLFEINAFPKPMRMEIERFLESI